MRRLFSGLVLFLLAACGQAAPPPPAPPAAERYVVTGSYIAEIFAALGAADQVVGVSGGTDHIAELAGVPRLPGFRQTSAENLLSLTPTVVILSDEVTTEGLAEQLAAAGVTVERFPADPSLEGIEDRIRHVGRLLGKESEAEALVARFEADLADAQALVAQTTSRPRGIFILSGGNRPTLIGGANTGTGRLIELAGGVNAAAAIDGFKVMSQEAMVEAAPDFFLVNPDGMTEREGVPVALSAPGAQRTPAGQNGRLVVLEGQYLQGFGLYTPEAIRRLARAIHPELASDGGG
jgi:iron complex transport system substrate-binding protein